MSRSLDNSGLLMRAAETGRERLSFTLDGESLEALVGDTVLTAVLTHRTTLRHTEYSAQARAGFCLMGACQDCWVSTESGSRLRACSTLVQAGMRLLTQAEPAS